MTPRQRAEGCIVPVFTVRDGARELARLYFAGLPTAYPLILMLPQSRIEAILGERLAELGGSIRGPWRVTGVSFQQDLAVQQAQDEQGRDLTLTADHVVGADGMHITVRESAGIGSSGSAYPVSSVLPTSAWSGRCRSRRYDRVELVDRDMTDLPFPRDPSTSFWPVWRCVTRIPPRRELAIAETLRVLPPNWAAGLHRHRGDGAVRGDRPAVRV